MGRYSNEKRAQLAQAAADRAAQAIKPEGASQPATVESTSEGEIRPEGERPSLRNEPRRLAMEEILARDLKSKGIEPEEEEKKPVETTAKTAVKAAVKTVEAVAEKVETTKAAETVEAKPEETKEAPEAKPEIKTVRVKVDGQEFDAPQSEVEDAGGIHAYQRDKAAENRLRKANETLAEAKRVQAEINQLVEKQRPPQQTDDEFIASKIEAIRFGTPEESAIALREVMTRSRIDPNTISNQAVIQMRRQGGIDKFREEFSEVATNPLLYKLAVAMENERISAIPQEAITNPNFVARFDWSDFYRRIGNEIRGAVGRPSQPASVPAKVEVPTNGAPSQVSSDKEARKASIVNLSTASARAESPKETKPETREDVLNEMRKKRGLPIG
jgi:hypothetical protein